MLNFVMLRYQGITYSGMYRVRPGGLEIWKGGLWQRMSTHRRGEYESYFVTNPITRKSQWIQAHAAIEESFNGGWAPGLVACHAPGTKPTDFKLGSCVGFYPQKVNRSHRREAGTSSTGPDTAPGKLTPSDVQRLIDGWDDERNKSLWARRLGCTRQNILHHLTQNRVALENQAAAAPTPTLSDQEEGRRR